MFRIVKNIGKIKKGFEYNILIQKFKHPHPNLPPLGRGKESVLATQTVLERYFAKVSACLKIIKKPPEISGGLFYFCNS